MMLAIVLFPICAIVPGITFKNEHNQQIVNKFFNFGKNEIEQFRFLSNEMN